MITVTYDDVRDALEDYVNVKKQQRATNTIHTQKRLEGAKNEFLRVYKAYRRQQRKRSA